MRWPIFLLVTITLVAPFNTPRYAAAADTRSAYEASDKNGDGRIDREEYHQRLTDIFFFTDVDRNGYLTINELSNVSAKAFKTADRNRDGKLSITEYIHARFKEFHTADKNGDGVLAREEIESR